MTFYFRPPSGSMQLYRLEKLALTRLNFLLRLVVTNGDPVKVHDLLTDISLVEESDCLIEGSRKDRISHFILRLAFAGRPDSREFFRRAEILFFKIRFLNMEENELSYLLHSIDPFLEKADLYTSCHNDHSADVICILQTFQNMLRKFESWENLLGLYFSGSCFEFIQVPFLFVLDLVRSRSVTLRNGIAYVSVSNLRLVVMALFETLLKAGMEKAQERYQSVIGDPRMNDMFAKLRNVFRASQPSLHREGGIERLLSHSEVDREAVFFPPCMSHLHGVLRDKHRLGHHSRIQYTLFLKEIGLPVHEALMFWRKEYSSVSGDKKSCCHDWRHDGKRYTYSIRHLYGLEGSRINYRGHCCYSLQQESFGHSETGGCPFVHFDQSHLTDLLQSESLDTESIETILKSSAKGDYHIACGEFLRYKSEIFQKDSMPMSQKLCLTQQSFEIQEKETRCVHECRNSQICVNMIDDAAVSVKDCHCNTVNDPTVEVNDINMTFDLSPFSVNTSKTSHKDNATKVSLIGDSGEIEATPVCCHDNDPCVTEVSSSDEEMDELDVKDANKFVTIVKPLDYYISATKLLQHEGS